MINIWVVRCGSNIIAVIYRQPSGAWNILKFFFENLLHYFISVNIKIAVVGDVYIDLLANESTKVEFLEIILTNLCTTSNSVPARITELT